MSEVQLNQEIEGEEYEEISSDEVDLVVETLDRLIESVNSENIKQMLEEASDRIYLLVYEEEDLAGEEEQEIVNELLENDDSPLSEAA